MELLDLGSTGHSDDGRMAAITLITDTGEVELSGNVATLEHLVFNLAAIIAKAKTVREPTSLAETWDVEALGVQRARDGAVVVTLNLPNKVTVRAALQPVLAEELTTLLLLV